MTSFTCRNLTPDIIRSWLDERLDLSQRDAMRAHLHGCPACSQAVTRTVSNGLWGFLTGEGRDRVPAFLDEVSNILRSAADSGRQVAAADSPTSPFQYLLAATRELLWEPFVVAPLQPFPTLSGNQVTVREVDVAGAPVGGVVVLSSPEHVEQPPVLTSNGRFRFAVRGTGASWIGKQLHCEIKLVEEQTASFDASIRATAGTDGWEAAIDEQVLTDQATFTPDDYRIPFDYVKLTVRPSTV